MNDLITLPASVRSRIEAATQLAEQQRPNEASAMLTAAGQALAFAQPELVALLLASQLGRDRIVATMTETNQYVNETRKTFLGIQYGCDRQVRTVTRIVAKDLRVL